MIRITGGQWRGRQIQSPPERTKGQSGIVRPTTGIVRQSLFNRLSAQIHGARFLDAFAGSGIMGFEALSRGANYVYAIEQDRRNAERILNNAQLLQLTDASYQLAVKNALQILGQHNPFEPFNTVFLDPPYGQVDLQQVLHLLQSNGWLASDATIAVEQSTRAPVLAGFTSRIFGDSVLCLTQMSGNMLEQ